MKKVLSSLCALLLLGISTVTPLAAIATSPKSTKPTYTAGLETDAPAASVTLPRPPAPPPRHYRVGMRLPDNSS